MTYLEHYGVKGMKWGVRKERSTKGYLKKANAIVSTMSKKERELLGVYNRQYSIDKGEKFLTKYIKTVENEPVSFFDIVGGSGYANAAVGTRSGEKYRGKGYAKEAVKKGIDWWDANKDKYGYEKLNWWVRRDNTGSIKLAKSSGFKLNKDDLDKWKDWYHFEKK